jgi:hypothetical protein
MIHGDICRPLFKVAYRVAPRGHHIAEELVRFRHRTGRPVDETRLDFTPGLHEARTIGGRKRSDVKRLDSLCALFEPRLRPPPVASFLDGTSIFSATELSTQSFSPALAEYQKRDHAGNKDRDDRNG